MGKRKLKRLFIFSDRINMNSDSKVVFISDVHRGNGGYTDALLKNKNIYLSALRYYLKEEYTLIELGDGDELWKNKDARHIAYEYKDVFRILNRFNTDKRLFMIWGNHDSIKRKKRFKDIQKKKLKQFGEGYGIEFLDLIYNIEFKESYVLSFEPLEKEIFVFHGHQLDFFNLELSRLSKFLVRYFWRFLEGILGFKEPTSPANNHVKCNNLDKEYKKFSKENKKMIICGHTHDVRFPSPEEELYFNDGSCVNNFGITTIEINRGVIALIKWSIEIDENNRLYIKRSVIEGPETLSNYFKKLE